MDIATIAPLLFTLALVVGAFLFARRTGGGSALSELERANRVLERRLGELDTQHRLDQQQIALLDARTSLEPMVGAVVDQFDRHEQRAAKRHDQAMIVWELIAARLGTDPES